MFVPPFNLANWDIAAGWYCGNTSPQGGMGACRACSECIMLRTSRMARVSPCWLTSSCCTSAMQEFLRHAVKAEDNEGQALRDMQIRCAAAVPPWHIAKCCMHARFLLGCCCAVAGWLGRHQVQEAPAGKCS